MIYSAIEIERVCWNRMRLKQRCQTELSQIHAAILPYKINYVFYLLSIQNILFVTFLTKIKFIILSDVSIFLINKILYKFRNFWKSFYSNLLTRVHSSIVHSIDHHILIYHSNSFDEPNLEFENSDGIPRLEYRQTFRWQIDVL